MKRMFLFFIVVLLSFSFVSCTSADLKKENSSDPTSDTSSLSNGNNTSSAIPQGEPVPTFTVDWPSEMLPSDFPDLGKITKVYDSRAFVKKVTVNWNIVSEDQAKEIVDKLNAYGYDYTYPVAFSSAIDVNKFDASLQIINAIISIDNYVVGINVPSGDVTVQGSRITVTNADCGISGGNEIDNFLIQGSVLDLTGEGVSSVGLLNGRDIQIDSSLIKITSQNSNAVYTDGAITVRNGSVLEMKAFYPALFSTLDTTITDSTVIAISTDDSGIYSRANILINGTSDILARGHWAGINANGNITINSGKIYSTSSHDMGIYLRGIFTMNGGDVYAQGATGFAAIGARYTKQEGDTEPVEKIVINSNYADIGGGKVSVSDWYSGASGEINWSRSWSSFVAGNDGNTKSNYNYSIIIAHGAFFLY